MNEHFFLFKYNKVNETLKLSIILILNHQKPIRHLKVNIQI